MIEEDIEPSFSSNLSLTPKGTATNMSTTENTAIENIERIEIKQLKQKRDLLNNDVDTVDRLLEVLNGTRKKVVEMRIKDKMSWSKIAEELDFDVRTATKIYNSLFEELELLRKRPLLKVQDG
jgi:DNA-binding transcriptional regulator YiaG